MNPSLKSLGALLKAANAESGGEINGALLASVMASMPRTVQSAQTFSPDDVPVPMTPEQAAADSEQWANRSNAEKIGRALKQALLMGGATDIRNMVGAMPPTAAEGPHIAGNLLSYLKDTGVLSSGQPAMLGGLAHQRGFLSMGDNAAAQAERLAGKAAGIKQAVQDEGMLANELSNIADVSGKGLLSQYNAIDPTDHIARARKLKEIAGLLFKGNPEGFHPLGGALAQAEGHGAQAGNPLLRQLILGGR